MGKMMDWFIVNPSLELTPGIWEPPCEESHLEANSEGAELTVRE
jgi:hypothetical protein